MCKMWLDFVVSWLSLGTTDPGWNMRFVLAVGANANWYIFGEPGTHGGDSSKIFEDFCVKKGPGGGIFCFA